MILVDVYVPAVDESFDFQLDENADLGSVMLELTGMITRRTRSLDPGNTGEFMMYYVGQEKPLPLNRTLYESGVRDGDRLILV